MADNYTLFSEMIDRVTAAEQAWLAKRLEEDLEKGWPSFDYKFEKEGQALWLYSEVDADVGELAEFVRDFLAKFRPDEFFSLTWANTCSSPRLSEFGGGAVFITADEIKWCSPYQWVFDNEALFRERKK